MPFVVAIDGPAGSGKSTIARAVAARLGLLHLDTGALYRVVTHAAARRGVASEEETAALARALEIRFEGERVFADDEEVTKAIRHPAVTADVSRVAAMATVREALLEVQRRMAASAKVGAVMEGRDIGTVVFPDAEVKVFLTASPEERARRRAAELQGAVYEEVLAQIRVRDQKDSERAVAPLRAAPDAHHLDSTDKPINEVVDRIAEIASPLRGRSRS